MVSDEAEIILESEKNRKNASDMNGFGLIRGGVSDVVHKYKTVA